MKRGKKDPDLGIRFFFFIDEKETRNKVLHSRMYLQKNIIINFIIVLCDQSNCLPVDSFIVETIDVLNVQRIEIM